MSPLRLRPARLGLALGGGGARGGIHVGVLKALDDHRVPVHCVVGTSVGALLGGLYCLTLSARELEQRLLEYLESDVYRRTRFNLMAETSRGTRFRLFTRISSFLKEEFLLTLALSRPYLISRERALESLAFFLRDARVEDTRIPFAAVATDLETGEEVMIRDGSLADAVYASCTCPGIVEATRLQGRLLVDGGVVSMVPVGAARKLGAEVVVGANADRRIEESVDDLSGIEILFRADDIMGAELTRRQTQEADILIHPGSCEGKWYDFQKAAEYIATGEQEAREKMPEIRNALYGGSLRRLLRDIRIPG